MADTVPAAFDPKPKHLGLVMTYKAGAAILAGQVVAFHGTGVTDTVHPCVAGTTEAPVGVALYSAAKDALVAVAGNGSVLKVCEGAGAAIDAGHGVMVDDTAGCVITGTDAAAAWWVGVAQEDIAANGTGYIEVQIQHVPETGAS
jgi:hypothetical protein